MADERPRIPQPPPDVGGVLMGDAVGLPSAGWTGRVTEVERERYLRVAWDHLRDDPCVPWRYWVYDIDHVRRFWRRSSDHAWEIVIG